MRLLPDPVLLVGGSPLPVDGLARRQRRPLATKGDVVASKTGKRAKAAAKKSNLPAPKDDGTRWVVMRDGRQVYPGAGVTRDQADHLNQGLREPGELLQVA